MRSLAAQASPAPDSATPGKVADVGEAVRSRQLSPATPATPATPAPAAPSTTPVALSPSPVALALSDDDDATAVAAAFAAALAVAGRRPPRRAAHTVRTWTGRLAQARPCISSSRFFPYYAYDENTQRLVKLTITSAPRSEVDDRDAESNTLLLLASQYGAHEVIWSSRARTHAHTHTHTQIARTPS